MQSQPRRRGFHPVYLLLVLPFAGMLWIPLFNRIEPALFGIPFFYWYQTLWAFLCTACIVPVYLHEVKNGK